MKPEYPVHEKRQKHTASMALPCRAERQRFRLGRGASWLKSFISRRVSSQRKGRGSSSSNRVRRVAGPPLPTPAVALLSGCPPHFSGQRSTPRRRLQGKYALGPRTSSFLQRGRKISGVCTRCC